MMRARSSEARPRTVGAFLGLAPAVLAIALLAPQSQGAIRYVRAGNYPGQEYPYTTPETAAATIPSALDAALSGDVVLVYPGVYGQFYHHPGPPPLRVKQGVRLVGFGADRTAVLEDVVAEPGSLVAGFRMVSCILRSQWGDVGVRDCLFDGSMIFAELGPVSVRRCRFEALWNRNYCIEVTEGFGAPVTVEDCSFDLRGTPSEGGMGVIGAAPLSVRRCVFTGCERAISIGEGRAEISNCVFSQNQVGLRSGGLDLVVQNCTFYRNAWAITSASNSYSQLFRNCIIWANENGNVLEKKLGYPPDVYLPVITFSDVEGGYPGRGNIDADPMFFLPSADEADLHLCAFSPCVDAGDPFSDYTNEREPNGGRVNMGAYRNTWEATTSELVDTDGDNLRDDWEMEHFATLDGDGSGDADDDGLVDREEYRHLSDPNNPDSDGDGLLDGEEVMDFNTDPILPDTDNDGTPDGKEIAQGTDPLDPWDAFTIIKFWIEDDQVHVVHSVQPRCGYVLQSSYRPGGPFGWLGGWSGTYGVVTHTFVHDLNPHTRFFRVRARPF